MKTLEGKITTQERNLEAKIGKTDNQLTEVKKDLKDIGTKAGSSKPDDSLKKEIEKISSQLGVQEKNLTDKISKQITESQKTVQEKIAAQEKSVKDAVDKIGTHTRPSYHIDILFDINFHLQPSLKRMMQQILPRLVVKLQSLQF